MTYHPDFTPTCAEHGGEYAPERAVTMGAGVQWAEAYAFAEEHGITLVGGEIYLTESWCTIPPGLGPFSCVVLVQHVMDG